MPLPLVWLGAGAAALFAGTKLTREIQKSQGYINHFPGECKRAVQPIDGAVVCCGIYEVFQHTGIWVDNNIIELRGNGLIRGISPERFLTERSGNTIFVACDKHRQPLVKPDTAAVASSRLFEYSEYDLLSNNCHRFTMHCVTGVDRQITRFAELNATMCATFNTKIYWQPIINA
ncbi:hypothetical protein QTP81_10030 [Alteromonas sp. ASW11-36]|uniref:LRAT domain-containing protein n=1 Tax=Alteromonas arenosi TaxID=3055817 RepID=A0ABT7SXL4_9ALTE|nr:hypothetical protein [Alteromonas sp. ASW11-36]MDM7860934.1 hypothetical protein [Alteromonas sp. ASW11-36]